MGLWQKWNDKHDEIKANRQKNKDNVKILKEHKAAKVGQHYLDDVDQVIYKTGTMADPEFRFIPYADIIAYQPDIEGESKNKKHGITRALVGGAIAGGAGAVVGAVTGGKDFKIIKKIEIMVQTKDFDRIHLVLMDSPFKADSFVVKGNLKLLEEYSIKFDRILATNKLQDNDENESAIITE